MTKSSARFFYAGLVSSVCIGVLIYICITAFFFQDLQSQSEGIEKPSTDKMVYILIAVIALMVVVLSIFIFFYIRNTLRYVKLTNKEMLLTNIIKILRLKLGFN